MFGIPDVGVLLAIITSLISVIACVVYGIIYWNEDEEKDANKDKE